MVKCFSLEPMATEMLHEARNWELQAQWYKRKAGSADGEKRDVFGEKLGKYDEKTLEKSSF